MALVNRQKVIDSQFTCVLPQNAVIYTLNTKRNDELYLRAERSALDKLKTPKQKEKRPKQDWYITAMKLGHSSQQVGIDPDFIYINGLVSGLHFKLSQLNPVIAKSLQAQPDEECKAVRELPARQDLSEDEYLSDDNLEKKTRNQQIFVCHVCKTAGTWHDSISCPCRKVVCNICNLVGHSSQRCKMTPSEKNTCATFWSERTLFNSKKLYFRFVPATAKIFYVDCLLELNEYDQLILVSDKATEFHSGLPDLEDFQRKIVQSLEDVVPDQQLVTPEDHSPFKLYCSACRNSHVSSQCPYYPSVTKPFNSKTKFEQSLNLMINSQKGKLKRHYRFIQADKKVELTQDEECCIIESDKSQVVAIQPSLPLKKREKKALEKALVEVDDWDAKFKKSSVEISASQHQVVGKQTVLSQKKEEIKEFSPQEKSGGLWQRPRDDYGNLIELSLHMREALGYWK